MTQKPALVNVMTTAAGRAGRNLRRDFQEIEYLDLQKKGPADFVTAADLNAEKVIAKELKKARPHFGMMLEENAPHLPKEEEYWVVDPLDGTTNFIQKIPHFAISIGAVANNEVIAGVIYNPITDEMFWAQKGFGAYVNDKRIRVSNKKDISECLLATGIPWRGRGTSENRSIFRNELAKAMEFTAGIRRFGAASLDLAYVACGRFDGFWERDLSPWDLAAGIIIIKEAGGHVSDLSLGQNMLKKGNILAGNFDIHDGISQMFKK